MTARRASAARYRRTFSRNGKARVDVRQAAEALAAAHPSVDPKAAQRHFAYYWFHGVPVQEVLRLMDTPVSELPARVLAHSEGHMSRGNTPEITRTAFGQG